MKNNYKTYRSFLKSKFNGPVFKVTIHGGFSCPNILTGGCVFCDTKAFSPAANKSDLDPVGQLLRATDRNKKNYEHFIAYLQPNTNTYGTIDELKAVYEPLLKVAGVVGLAIGTRPDCLDDDILEYLEDLSKRTYLSVELGLQSTNDNTLKKINRGHNFETFKSAVEKLTSKNIEVIVHLMAGLPGEGRDELLKSIKDVCALPINGIKLHQLMVLKNTACEKLYEAGEIEELTLSDYAETLALIMPYIRKDICIHRLMADTPSFNENLITPMWSADKKTSQHYIQQYLINNNVIQGQKFKSEV